jgi:hypothetical protein
MSNSVEFLYTANTSLATLTTGNSVLTGASGSIPLVITGAASGTLVKTIIVKAQVATAEGMIRFFVKKSGDKNLIKEVYVYPTPISGRDPSWSAVIPFNYTLESGDLFYMTTENTETFGVVAECLDISYGATAAYLGSTLKYVWNSGSEKILTGNANLDGTGAVQIFQAGAAGSGYQGCAISSIKIKAQVTTTPGMVRLYVGPGGMSPPTLFSEIMVPNVAQSATLRTFEAEVLRGTFCLQPDYFIYATTENSERFSIIIEGADWKYV